MTYDQAISLGKNYFNFWVNNPDKEVYLFTECESPIEVLSEVYTALVKLKKIERLEWLQDEEKFKLKQECKRIYPNGDPQKGMKIVKSIYVFGYLSNIL